MTSALMDSLTQIGYTDKGQIMKLWEITHVIGGITMVERVEASTKMAARGVLVRHYLRQLELVSVEEVEEIA